MERRFGTDLLPLADLVPGYERNAHAAATLLRLLEAHVELDATLVAAVRELISRASDRAVDGEPAIPAAGSHRPPC